MAVVERLAGELKKIFDAPERAEGDKIIDFHANKTEKFIGQLLSLKSETDVENAKATLDSYISGEHEVFAKELEDIKESIGTATGNHKIDALVTELKAFKDGITGVKNAPTREIGDSLLKEMKW